MLVEFSTRHVDGIAVVDVKGMLQPRVEDRPFLLSTYVSNLIGQGDKKILLNLGGVTKHDNSGVGELIACQTVVRKQGAELKLANLSQTMLARIKFNRLDIVFQIYESEAAAIKAFQQNEGGPVTSLQISTPSEVNPEGATKHDNSGLEEQAAAIKAFQEDRWPSLQPSLHISTRQVGDVAVIDIKGSFQQGPSRTLLLDRYVSDLIDQGNRKILLNLPALTEHDNMGVAALFACAKTVRARGVELKLTNVSQSMLAYLNLTKLDTALRTYQFQTYENEETAIKAFCLPFLQISARHVDGVAVVDVKGSLRLRGTGRTLLLDGYVSGLIGQGNKKILLNLQGVRDQDNTGVGALCACLKTVRARGAELKLAYVSQSILASLTLIRLIKVFQIYENEAAAIEAFQG